MLLFINLDFVYSQTWPIKTDDIHFTIRIKSAVKQNKGIGKNKQLKITAILRVKPMSICCTYDRYLGTFLLILSSEPKNNKYIIHKIYIQALLTLFMPFLVHYLFAN